MYTYGFCVYSLQGGVRSRSGRPLTNVTYILESPYTHSLLVHEEETMTVSTSSRSAFFSHEYHVRLILLGIGSLLHWKDQLPVGGMPVYYQMVKKQCSPIRPI